MLIGWLLIHVLIVFVFPSAEWFLSDSVGEVASVNSLLSVIFAGEEFRFFLIIIFHQLFFVFCFKF